MDSGIFLVIVGSAWSLQKQLHQRLCLIDVVNHACAGVLAGLMGAEKQAVLVFIQHLLWALRAGCVF